MLVPGRRAPRLSWVALSLPRPDKPPGSAGPGCGLGGRADGEREAGGRSLWLEEAGAAPGSSRRPGPRELQLPAQLPGAPRSSAPAHQLRLPCKLPPLPPPRAPGLAEAVPAPPSSPAQPDPALHNLPVEPNTAPPSAPAQPDLPLASPPDGA